MLHQAAWSKQFDCKISKSCINGSQTSSLYHDEIIHITDILNASHPKPICEPNRLHVETYLNSSYGKKMRWILFGVDTKTDLANRKTIIIMTCLGNNTGTHLALNSTDCTEQRINTVYRWVTLAIRRTRTHKLWVITYDGGMIKHNQLETSRVTLSCIDLYYFRTYQINVIL